jgi:hypothetical protein
MDNLPLPPGIFALGSILSLVLACGLVVWLVRAIGRGNKKKSEQPLSPASTPVEQAQAPPVQEVQPAAASETEQPSPAEPPGEQELLRVSRTAEGDLVVLAQRQPVRRLRDINDPRLGEDTIEAVRAVLTFAEGWVSFIEKWSAEAASAAQPSLGQQPRPEPLPRAAPPHAGRPAHFPSTTTIPRPGRMLEPLPLIDEVNDLVQRRLKESPDLAGHLITLTTAIDGSLRIYVDQRAFQAVDDITDLRVQALIQGAIREWEDSWR